MPTLFESVSGFTTTGASILTDVEAAHGTALLASPALLHGGVGIILFVLLVLPERKVQSSFYRAEVSDLSKMSFPHPFTPYRAHHRHRLFHPDHHRDHPAEAAGHELLRCRLSLILHNRHLRLLHPQPKHRRLQQCPHRDDHHHLHVTQQHALRTRICHHDRQEAQHLHFPSQQDVHDSGRRRILLIALQLFNEAQYSLGDSFRYAAFQVVSLTSTTGLTADTSLWRSSSPLCCSSTSRSSAAW